MRKITILLFTLLIIGCDSRDIHYSGLNSTLWMQSSAEYVASAEQAFNAARMNLDKALRNKNWTAALEQRGNYQNLPPAVIFDVDETVLDNSPYEAYLITSKQAYHYKTWQVWVNAARAQPIKGVKELIEEIKARGVDVFYVTNRDESLKEATVKNIRIMVDPEVQTDRILFRTERAQWGGDKSSRRAAIAGTHRIIMIFGDDYNDFRSLAGSPSPSARVAEVEPYREYWGTKWILLSNPRYGYWERAIFNYAHKLPDDEKLQAKRLYLKPDSGASDNDVSDSAVSDSG